MITSEIWGTWGQIDSESTSRISFSVSLASTVAENTLVEHFNMPYSFQHVFLAAYIAPMTLF